MAFGEGSFGREKAWSGELLNGIALYCVDKFFVDRVCKKPVLIPFDGSRGLQDRLQQRSGAPLESNAPLDGMETAYL